MDTIKVKPWSESQGDHVVINAADFDPKFHRRLDDESGDDKAGQDASNAGALDAMSADELKAALTAKGIAFRANASRGKLVELLTGAKE